jgi:hypothetical protein
MYHTTSTIAASLQKSSMAYGRVGQIEEVFHQSMGMTNDRWVNGRASIGLMRSFHSPTKIIDGQWLGRPV